MFRPIGTRVFSWGVFVFLAVCLGCDDGLQPNDAVPGGSTTGGSAASGGSSRIIPLDGAEYLLTSRGSTRCNFRGEGLQPLGDIDNDGNPDISVALNRKVAGGIAKHTWIEAYSGGSGKRLWSLQGHHDRDTTKHYRLGSFAVVEDFDGDKVRDIYSLEAHSRRWALLISGRTGQLIGRYQLERKPEFSLPLRSRDYNRDGAADLMFSRSSVKPLVVTVISGKDFSVMAELDNVWPEAKNDRIEWVLPEYHDENGDKIGDCLVRRQLPNKSDGSPPVYEYAVLDGAKFRVLRTFSSAKPQISAKTFFAATGDLNGDGRKDFVFSSGAGGGTQGRQTLLRAVSGADGKILWDLSGGQLGEGAKSWSVDTKTGAKTEHGPDLGFGGAIVVVDDKDGDGIDDIAALSDAGADGGKRPGVLIISGKTGQVISTLALTDRQGRMMRNAQMARLSMDPAKGSSFVVSARSPDGKAALAVFE